jgi:MutS domain V
MDLLLLSIFLFLSINGLGKLFWSSRSLTTPPGIFDRVHGWTTTTTSTTIHASCRHNPRHDRRRRRRRPSTILAAVSSSDSSLKTSSPSSSSFPEELISSLDLVPLIEAVARHTGTKRGYDALLSLANKHPSTTDTMNVLMSSSSSLFGRSSTSSSSSSASDRLKRQQQQFRLESMKERNNKLGKNNLSPLTTIATSMEEVNQAYALTKEAIALLSKVDKKFYTSSPLPRPQYPPIYGVDSDPFDDVNIVTSDDDEWLYLPAQDWTVENLLHAEQVICKMLDVKEWGKKNNPSSNGINNYNPVESLISSTDDDEYQCTAAAPTLYEMAISIDSNNDLRSVYDTTSGTAEIVRAKSLVDPNGRSSYQMRLCVEKFPVLQLLHDKQSKMFQRGAKEFDKDVVEIQNEIDSTTEQILIGLAQNVLSVSEQINHGLDVISRLDVIMAKAAYGIALNGRIPVVQSEGTIDVKGFVHPILVGQAADVNNVVPIDLQLSTVLSGNDQRALLITGANGGGKTAALKSFGLVSILSKLGIPIPVRNSSSNDPPHVDYFDHVIANIGDRQNLLDGESTWTSIVNSCAATISRLNEVHSSDACKNLRWLVLLDELGSGTDPEAGGAIAQAVLEEILSVTTCSVVATTHSPRLKALSFDDPTYGCASVLLQENSDDAEDEQSTDRMKFKLPCFKLEYGIIGESYALGAASRSRPPLPPRVLTRASELLSQSTGEGESESRGEYILALSKSMEKQLQRQESSMIEMETSVENARECQRATIALASSFQTYIGRVEDRLEDIYRRLKDSNGTVDMNIVGETISQVRLVKKEVMSQKEKLASQGLKMVPTQKMIRPGDSVVIVSEGGKWDGITAQIVADPSTDSTLKPTELLVKPSFSMEAWSWGEGDMQYDYDPVKDRYLIVQRHELAEWCDIEASFESSTVTSVSDSKQKLNSLLSSLNSVSSGGNRSNGKKESNSAFRSSRDRKAAKRKRK